MLSQEAFAKMALFCSPNLPNFPDIDWNMKLGLREFPAAIYRQETKRWHEPKLKNAYILTMLKLVPKLDMNIAIPVRCLHLYEVNHGTYYLSRLTFQGLAYQFPSAIWSKSAEYNFLATSPYFQVAIVWLPGRAMPNPDNAECLSSYTMYKM